MKDGNDLQKHTRPVSNDGLMAPPKTAVSRMLLMDEEIV